MSNDNQSSRRMSGACRWGRRLGEFTDIHCHCLPGLDDGPADMGEALAVCRALLDDAVSEVVATPHQLGRFDGHCNAHAVRQAVEQLNQALRENNINLTVLPGADVRLDERLPALLRSDHVMTLGDGGRWLLLELPHEIFIDPHVLLGQLDRLGIGAVITHPERHSRLAHDPAQVNRWVEYRPCLQITAGSLLGDFGHRCQDAAWAFLHVELPIVVATDAHDTGSRCPRMTAAYRRLSERLGQSAARLLCIENPRRLLAGQELFPLKGELEGEVE